MMTLRSAWRWLSRPAALAAVSALAAVTASAGEARFDDPASDVVAAPTAHDWLPWTSFGSSSAGSGVTRVPNGVLVTRSGGDVVSLSRQTFGIGSDALVLRFNLSLSHASASRTAAQVLRVGTNFTTSNVDEPDAATYARLGVNVQAGDGFQLRDLTGRVNGPTFTGTQAVTWVLNRSGGARSYSAPDGTREAIANDRMDVWVGRNMVFNDIAVTTPRTGMDDIKWFWADGDGTTTIARFEARPLSDFAGGTATEPAAVTEAAVQDAPDASPGIGALQLYRPSPNPFERTMRYAYAISNQVERVDIGVYDVAGRLIRSLSRGTQAPGQYEVEWDGRDDDGGHVRHGVYFLRANVGSQRRVARVVHLFE